MRTWACVCSCAHACACCPSIIACVIERDSSEGFAKKFDFSKTVSAFVTFDYDLPYRFILRPPCGDFPTNVQC